MKRLYIYILLLSLCSTVGAQKPKVAKSTAKPVVKEEDPRLNEMRLSTQKIIFIDSIVVNKNEILNALNLTQDAGIIATFSQFFNTSDDGDSYVFQNEMGNKCYYPKIDKGQKELFTSDLIDAQWTDENKVTGLCEENELTDKNYPFMMSDGTTLYFAAKGEESIGGWDIFVTRYDPEDNTYLKAENIGMPFNSTANDYFYIVDDINGIGWFASDRNQAEGKVCIYTFIPSETRENYDPDKLPDNILRALANLNSIKDTWGNGKERTEALQRLNAARNSNSDLTKEFKLVINDTSEYTDYSQFKHKENVNKMKAVVNARNKLNSVMQNLEKSRAVYAKANTNEKEILSSKILDLEQEEEELQILIASKEKEIRNSENMK